MEPMEAGFEGIAVSRRSCHRAVCEEGFGGGITGGICPDRKRDRCVTKAATYLRAVDRGLIWFRVSACGIHMLGR
ncbi:MAG TPA: hypothetical protein DIT89_08880 [Planctomycetaceae bacterium]|nr:hypothetical protein [Planctomycetaceae bacterium]